MELVLKAKIGAQRVARGVVTAVTAAGLAVLAGSLTLAVPVNAQENPFAPAIAVNSRAISNFELSQRTIFFQLLDPNVDATAEARKSLIDDRLRQQAAEELGVSVTPEEVIAEVEGFAARGNLSAEEFLKLVGERGVMPETVRDFIANGVLWRAAVRQRFGGVIQISESQIDRAIAEGAGTGSEVKLLLSEILLQDEGPLDAMTLASRIKAEVVSELGFAQAARLHSKAPNAGRGGQVDWLLQSDLPPAVKTAVAGLEIGQMSEPLRDGAEVRLYYLRDISAAGEPLDGAEEVDFLQVALPAGADAERIRAGVDRCEDLMPVARGLPEEALLRETRTSGTLPAGLAATLARMDAGETALIAGDAGQATILMLCARHPASVAPPSREDVRAQLQNRQLAQRADAWLSALRAEARIVEY